MDPKEVKLTTAQKIVPLLKAINEEIPWQAALIICLSISAWVVGGALTPTIVDNAPIMNFIVRRIIVGFFAGAATFLITGLTIMTIEDKLIPLYRKIKDNYEKQALKAKKEILENVIDDEILK